MFNLDTNILSNRNIPNQWRKPKFKDWIKVFLSGIKSIHLEFLSFRDDTTYWLYFNGQIIYLEHVLDDQFDPINRGIYIENTADVQYYYLYNNIEQQPVYLNNASENASADYLLNESEYNNVYTFIVWVPSSVQFDEFKMRAIIDRYRLAGKTYTIQTY